MSEVNESTLTSQEIARIKKIRKRVVVSTGIVVGTILGITALTDKVQSDNQAKDQKHEIFLDTMRQGVIKKLATARWTSLQPGQATSVVEGTPELFNMADSVFPLDYMKNGQSNFGQDFVADQGFYALVEKPGECQTLKFMSDESGMGPLVEVMHVSANTNAAEFNYASRTLEVCNIDPFEENIVVVHAPPGSSHVSRYS